MSVSVGASSNALSYLQSLLTQGSAGAGNAKKASDPLAALLQSITGVGSSTEQTGSAPPPPPDTASGSHRPPFGPDMMAALISMQDQSDEASAQSPSKLFAKLDADGDGAISLSEFETAATSAGAEVSIADAVFAKIDADGDGAISQSELAKADRGGRHRAGGPPPPDGGGSGSSDSASGVTTTTTTNADGSTTTTISYPDGSKLEMTTAVPSEDTDADTATSKGAIDKTSANLLEQLIKLQSQLLNVATSTLSAVV